MPEYSPISVLLTDFLPADHSDGMEKEALKIDSLPPVRSLDLLKTPDKENDPTELIASRFLYRGGVCLVLGPTGVGKSSFLMQLGDLLRRGQTALRYHARKMLPRPWYAGPPHPGRK